MACTVRTIRRTIRAAHATSRHLLRAAIDGTFRLLVRLYTAIDEGATLRIAYTDETGTQTVRDIQPHALRATEQGHIVVTTWDLLRDARRDFRTDRLAIA